jgi:hypothetical protein
MSSSMGAETECAYEAQPRAQGWIGVAPFDMRDRLQAKHRLPQPVLAERGAARVSDGVRAAKSALLVDRARIPRPQAMRCARWSPVRARRWPSGVTHCRVSSVPVRSVASMSTWSPFSRWASQSSTMVAHDSDPASCLEMRVRMVAIAARRRWRVGQAVMVLRWTVEACPFGWVKVAKARHSRADHVLRDARWHGSARSCARQGLCTARTIEAYSTRVRSMAGDALVIHVTWIREWLTRQQ